MIKIYCSANPKAFQGYVDIKTWNFPTGESGFKIEDISQISHESYYDIYVQYGKDSDIFLAAQAVDALDNLGVPKENIELIISYLPYSRQDRVCHPGEGFSLNILMKFLETLGVNVTTYDIHSEAILEKYKFVSNVHQSDFTMYLPMHDFLIAPDAGAELKAKATAAWHELELVCLKKQRIGSNIVYMDHEFDTIQGDVCVVDDLADGGGTFLALAEMLKRTQPNIKSLSLYVTHGFFTAGIDKLKQYYDNIYVANLMSTDSEVINFVKEI